MSAAVRVESVPWSGQSTDIHHYSAPPDKSMCFKSPFARIVFSLVILIGLAGLSFSAAATTYYVRTDGGTSVQCTGTTNAPYSGSGTAQACAWNSLMEALPPNWLHSEAALIKGGDTVIIAAGSYPIGWQKGYYQRWGDNCAAQYAPACHPQPIPSGTAAQPTRILGAGWDSGCVAPPELWGTQGPNTVLSLDSSSNVMIACLSVTDHSTCTINYQPNPSYTCPTQATGTNDNDPGLGTYARVGLHAQDSSNVTLQDMSFHGLADQGVQAGRISNWTVTRVSVLGNGNVGWNGDLGGNNHTSTNSGTLTFTDFTVAWSGCQEQYPPNGKYINCYGQNEGGYGDGFGEAWTGGNFIFIRPVFQYNMQDGLDILYANGTGSVTVDRGLFGYNAGNDLKTSGNATVTNSIFVGYCNALQKSGMPIAGDGSSGVSGTMCRAGGGELQDMTAPGQVVTFAYNTVIGDGGCLYGGDPTSHETGAPLDANDVYNVYNNVFIGQPSALPSQSGQNACFAYFGSPQPATVNYANNLVWQTRNTTCDGIGIICKDPQLASEAMTTFDANLLTSSPAIGSANRSVYSVAWDFYGNPRAASGALDIGAVAYRGQPFLGQGSGDSPLPPAGGTSPASDAPVPSSPSATILKPVANDSASEAGTSYGGVQAGLDSERYAYQTRAGWMYPRQAAQGLQPVLASSRPVVTQAAAAANTVPPAVAEQPVPVVVAKTEPVTRPYLVALYGWIADVYYKVRHSFGY